LSCSPVLPDALSKRLHAATQLCIYAYMNIYTHIHTKTYNIYVCIMPIYMYLIHAYMYIYIHTYKQKHIIYMYILPYICVYVYIYMHTNKNI
jgi:hypothetical protein